MDGPAALVLCPTRELGLQVEALLKRLMVGLAHMRTALVVGGDPVPAQLHRLRSGVQAVVATPGRLAVLVRRLPDIAELVRSVRLVVLDEVDDILAAGFERQVRTVMDAVGRPRQLVAVSATIPPVTERALKALAVRPLLVAVGDVGAPTPNVVQTFLWVEEHVRAILDPRSARRNGWGKGVQDRH